MENDTLEVQKPEMDNNESDPGMEQMSFTDKVVGVITEPGVVFESIKKFPVKITDWLIPTLILIVFIIASQLIQMGNPAIKSDLRQKQIATLQKYVDEGKMPAEQFEKAIEGMDKMQSFQLIGTFVGVPVGTFFVLAFMALIYWLIGKFGLKGEPKYGHVFVLMGLTSVIGIIEVIITLIISILMGKFNAAPNLTLLISSVNSGPMFSILKSIDPISIWSMIVVGVGLAKLSSSTTLKSLYWVIGLWVIYILLAAFVLTKIPFMGGM
jgi:hypothetical protein